MGPLPAPAPGTPSSLSRSRAAVLATLQGRPEAATVADLTAVTGLHANTLREHLEALVQEGLVRRHPSAPSGRGRPAWLYQATRVGGHEAAEYAGLAVALARALHSHSEAPQEDAISAGTEWGRALARGRVGSGASGAREQVVELLEDLRFAPETAGDGRSVRLTRCPLLAAARSYPDEVCGVHLGIVRGALDELGADPAGSALFPFSEPGACRLSLGEAGHR